MIPDGSRVEIGDREVNVYLPVLSSILSSCRVSGFRVLRVVRAPRVDNGGWKDRNCVVWFRTHNMLLCDRFPAFNCFWTILIIGWNVYLTSYERDGMIIYQRGWL